MPRKRQSGEGGLYYDDKRKLWIGVVDIGLTDDGRRRQKRVTSRSQAEARRKLESVKKEMRDHGSPLGTKTVAEWGAFWVDGYKRGKPQTYRTYTSLLETWVYPRIGKKQVKDVRPSDLRGIYDAMRSGPKPRAGSTILKVHTMLSAMFEAARLERLVSANVVKDIRPPRATKPDRDTFTPDETLRILNAAALHPDGSKWMVSLYAGIRQGERLGATLDSIDPTTGMFTVRWNMVEGIYEHGCGGECGKRSGGHCPQRRLIIPDDIDCVPLEGRLLLVPPKSGEFRTFPLPGALVDELERHVSRLSMRENPHRLLWPALDGSPVTAKEDQAEWMALLREAGVDRPGATTHWARHTAISDMTAAGVPERVTGEIVGHRSPGVTGRYQHVASRDAAAAMGKLEQRRHSPDPE